MVDVIKRKCRTEGCSKRPSFGVAGTNTAEYCAQHAPDGVVDVKRRKCKIEGCCKIPPIGWQVRKGGVLHAARLGPDGIRQKRKCKTEGCIGGPSFGWQARKLRVCLARPGRDGRRLQQKESAEPKFAAKQPSFELAGSKTAEYRAQHAWMGWSMSRREIAEPKAAGVGHRSD
ncbi:unnamed protein product [Ascophyllum nodosum]